MDEGNTLRNAGIGAIVNVILSGFIPFAPAFGGLLAGYLQGGSRSEGIRVGAIAGALSLIPALLLGALILFAFVPVMAGGAEGFGIGAVGIVGTVVVGAIAALYLVGLSALGGWVGYITKCGEWEYSRWLGWHKKVKK